MLARLAALASRFPRYVVAVAVGVTLLAGVLGADVAGRLGSYGANDPASETSRTAVALEKATQIEVGDDIVVLLSHATRERLLTVSAILSADPGIGRVTSLLNTRSAAFVSRDRRSTYLIATFRRHADSGAAIDRVGQRLARVPGATVGGGAVANTAINRIVQDDLTRAELVAFPLLFLLSLWFFRSLVAALLPPVVGGIAILITFLGLRLLNGPLDLSVFALNLVTGLGLGLAIDWSLFMVSRYREEIAVHGAGAEALARTVQTAGRTVLFSALTVAAALASLLIFPQRFLYSMGVGGAMVALVGAAVALIVLPAILALLGERVNALAPRRLRRAAEREARGEERGFWYRLSTAVMRRPGRIAAASAALLIAFGLPALGIQFTSVDATVLPKDEPARVVDSTIKRDFPAARTAPIVVAAATAPGAALDRFRARVERLPGAVAVSEPREVTPTLTRIDVTSRYGELDGRTQDLVRAV
ncbi:MAG: putative drug exporter of the superfamily, partial [Thermoleophilaceae bacterium]|nr:putative drug exporter of the superfamily [Thermoleophilaceae bacterium]